MRGSGLSRMLCLLSMSWPVWSITAQATDSTEEAFAVIAAAHSAFTAYELRIDIDYRGAVPLAPLSARVVCTASQHCLRVFQNISTLETPERTILVNSIDRTLVVAEVRDNTVPPMSAAGDPGQALREWLKAGGHLSEGQPGPEGRTFVLEPPKHSAPSIRLTVDEKTHLIRRLTYEADPSRPEQHQIDIRYTWQAGPPASAPELDVSHYVTLRGESITPATAYADYRVIRRPRL